MPQETKVFSLTILGIFILATWLTIRRLANNNWQLGYNARIADEKREHRMKMLRQIQSKMADRIIQALERELGTGSWYGRDMELRTHHKDDMAHICVYDGDREDEGIIIHVTLVISEADEAIHIDSLKPIKQFVKTTDPEDPAIPDFIKNMLDTVKPKMHTRV